MAGDYTRFSFNPFDDFAAVLMQQGRVQLDADWNELIDIIDRRFRAETIDIIGRATVPKETPDGFKIALPAGKMTIGRGRIYVDGLLAENHGSAPIEFDATLAEQRDTLPVDYTAQPYLPSPDPLPAGGPHLVYVDVWRREVTAFEDPLLIEKAVGVDTATRYQTVWQVKVLANVGKVTCDTPLDQVPGWTAANPPAGGRLTTAAMGQPATNDPCIIAPNGGYRGTENRLYRLEVHDPGPLGAATFKWSRDNASIVTTVTAINAARDQLTVTQVAKDSILRFSPGDWVEVIDDVLELQGKPGVLAKVQSVDTANQIITLAQKVPPGLFPTSGAGGATDPSRHTRARRWDQKGLVRDQNSNVVANVDAGLGAIKLAAATPSFVLEDGVQVTLSVDPATGLFRTGDYWVFAARTADASIQVLQQAPPRGIHHHYAKLALITPPTLPTDCRHLWPPDVAAEGCDCSVCVTPESHNGGTLTIQRAIDQVKAKGGKVCLGPGQYNLSEPISIVGGVSVHVQGHGATTLLTFFGATPAFVIQDSADVTVADLAMLTVGPPSPDVYGDSSSILLQNCLAIKIKGCFVVNLSTLTAARKAPDGEGACIGLVGIVAGASIRDNLLVGRCAIASLAKPLEGKRARAGFLFTFSLVLEDNLIIGRDLGVLLDGLALLVGETRIAGNSIAGCNQSAVTVTGFVPIREPAHPGGLPGGRTSVLSSHLDAVGNTIMATGAGVTIGVDEARVQSNDISPLSAASKDGIVLRTGLSPSGIGDCLIVGNRISGLGGNGITILTTLSSGMIKQNFIQDVSGGGIVVTGNGGGGLISVENNQFTAIAAQVDRRTPAVGISLQNILQARVTGNVINGVGTSGGIGAFGIQTVACSSLLIAANEVADVGPDQFGGLSAGIAILSPFHQADIQGNAVKRRLVNLKVPRADWLGLAINHISEPTFTGSVGLATNLRALGASDGPSAVVNLQDRNLFILGNRAIFQPPADDILSVRGNHFEASGTFQLVDCHVKGAVTFDANRCVQIDQTSPDEVSSILLIMLQGAVIICSSNYGQSPRSRTGRSIALLPNAGQFTVLGNITTAGIEVGGTALPPPWAPLNVLLP